MKGVKLTGWLAIIAILAGCASQGHRAPIIERSKGAPKPPAAAPAPPSQTRPHDWRPESIFVQKGDTLYSIAFNYGFDYRELAELNGIKDPSVISIGQEIRLFPGRPVSRPISAVPPGVPAAPTPAVSPPIKEQPKLVKYAYSDAALASIEKGDEPGPVAARPAPEVSTPSPQPKSVTDSADTGDDQEDARLEWGMPAHGKLIAQFSEPANRKGIDISGKLGDPVLASADGKVVYSGSGLRGYGKLIIIKHDNTYLSVYAHNRELLVKEGERVTRGQKIAEMGSLDSDQVGLHFEIRRRGKPVDPLKYLPPQASQ